VPDPTTHTIKTRKPSFSTSRHAVTSLRATWLGHACYHVEFPGGLRVLFDPVFEECCSPFKAKNFKRFTNPPCEIEDIPFVDVVVISHNHYDHLSYPTIQRIWKRFPNVQFLVPLANGAWFESCGIGRERVTELDWWETRDVRLVERRAEGNASSSSNVEVEVTKEGEQNGGHEKKSIVATIGALPCQHGSARGPFDRSKALWASWSVESGGKKVYFAGYVQFFLFFSLPRSYHIPLPRFSVRPLQTNIIF
jgi:L-ascorbate metabolism protein UlaG (beta-lactamase superfamily)